MSTDRRKPSQHIYCSGFWVRVNGPGKPSAWRASQWKPSSQCSSTSWAARAPPPGASLLGVRAPLSVSGPNLTFVCRGGGCGARSRFPPWRSKSPHAGRNPPHGDTPCFQWTPGPRTPRGLPLPVHTLRWRAGGRAREAPGPQAKNKGAGAPPRPPRAAPLPRPRAARNGGRSTKWQPGGPRSGEPSPRPEFLPTLSMRPSRSRAAGKGARARATPPLAPGPPSPASRPPRWVLSIGAPRPGASASIFQMSPPFRVSQAASLSPCFLPGWECVVGRGLC